MHKAEKQNKATEGLVSRGARWPLPLLKSSMQVPLVENNQLRKYQHLLPADGMGGWGGCSKGTLSARVIGSVQCRQLPSLGNHPQETLGEGCLLWHHLG